MKDLTQKVPVKRVDEWYSSLDPKQIAEIEKALKKDSKSEDLLNLVYSYHPQGHINLEPVATLEEYFRLIRLSTNEGSWFRGESREHESFIPKLYRNVAEDKIEERLELEKRYFFEFRRRSKSIVDNVEYNDFWSWYFLLQHYGGATRLMDWTSDASTALFIALDTSRERTDNPVIYVLTPRVLSINAFQEIGNKIETCADALYPGEDDSDRWIGNLKNSQNPIPDSPVPLLPAHSDPRIIAQKSCFTLFGKRVNGFHKDSKEIVCDCCGNRIRRKIIIDAKKKNELRRELAMIGVTSASVYPGLEGITKELNQEFYS